MKYTLCYLILTIWILQSCNRQDCCPAFFQIPFTVSPHQSVYRVGDTITVLSKFHREVTAFNIEQKELGTFDMKGILWLPYTHVYRVDTIIMDNSLYSLFDDAFEYIDDSLSNYGTIQYSISGIGLIGEYNYARDSFYLSYKMVCGKPGIYLLQNRSAVHGGHGPIQEFPGMCNPRDGFDAWSIMNNGVDNNFEFLKESPYEVWNTNLVRQEETGRAFYKMGCFCFKVEL